jgi:hypothetical protein
MITEYDTLYTSKLVEQGETWHGLEVKVDKIAQDGSNVPEVFCPIVEAGLKPDFEAEVCTLPPEEREELGGLDFSEWKILLADCRAGLSGKVLPLHVPKAGYKVHQNRDLFMAMVGAAKQVLGPDGFEIATCGTLGAYSQFLVSVAIKGKEGFDVGTLPDGRPDTWLQFFNLNSSHNGLIASMRGLSAIRQVCWNTVNAAQRDAEANGTGKVIKHTANSGELITPEKFAADLEGWLDQSAKLQALLAGIKAAPMTLDGFRAFAAGVFTQEGSDKLSTNSYNRITEMESLFARGRGNLGASLYDAINAFTEYFTSGAGVGKMGNVARGKRVASANFGRGNDWKLEAMRVACDPEVMAATAARGATLYADKLADKGK